MDERKDLFIGGEWTTPGTPRRIEVVSPHTERPLARVAAAGVPDVDRAVAAARRAFDEGQIGRASGGERVCRFWCRS
ncbi:aldehyde dehydrogenase family protein, partial [Spirillospora sp. NPDC046719]